MDQNGYSYIPSESNFFLLDTKRAGKSVIDAMARQSVIIGRTWPAMPTHVRVTVGTRPEMEQFQAAFKKVMDGTAVGAIRSPRRNQRPHMDGLAYPS